MYKKQTGMALVAALMFVAIAAGLAVYATSRNHRVLMRLDQSIRLAKAETAISYSLAWGRSQLANIAPPEGIQSDVVHLDQNWNKPIEAVLPGGMQLQAFLTDLQGNWNINNIPALFTPNEQTQGEQSPDQAQVQDQAQMLAQYAPQVITNILMQTEAAKDTSEAGLAQINLFYWVQALSNELEQWYLDPKPDGPRYRAAHQPLASLSELSLVRYFNWDMLSVLSSALSVLPVPDNAAYLPLNVNTCSDTVLAAVAQILPGQAKALTAKRPYIRIGDFNLVLAAVSKGQGAGQGAGQEGSQSPAALLDVSSNYFLLTTTVTLGEWTAKHYALLQRGDRQTVAMLWQAWGAY